MRDHVGHWVAPADLEADGPRAVLPNVAAEVPTDLEISMRQTIADRKKTVDDVSAPLPHLGPSLRLAVHLPESNQRFTEAPATVAACGVGR